VAPDLQKFKIVRPPDAPKHAQSSCNAAQ